MNTCKAFQCLAHQALNEIAIINNKKCYYYYYFYYYFLFALLQSDLPSVSHCLHLYSLLLETHERAL